MIGTTRFGVLFGLTALVVGAACSDSDSSGTTKTAASASAGGDDDAGGDDGGAGALPAAPQELTFSATGGPELTAVYYPAAVNPAPVVVFFHWVGGDKSDWFEVAPWLQNRGVQNPFENPGVEPWWDRGWFPEIDDGVSYAVLIVSLRGCSPSPIGCTQGEPVEWLADATAAMQLASTLEGVDPARIAAVGSSIGADAAPDACAAANQAEPGSCVGALSLSPGGFLDVPYPQAVADLASTTPPTPAWCLASPDEVALCHEADDAGNTAFRAIEIGEGGHGNRLIVPEADPSALRVLLDFLAELFPA